MFVPIVAKISILFFVAVEISPLSVVWKLLAAHRGARKKRGNSSSKAPHSQFSLKILLFSEAVGSYTSFSAGRQVSHLSDHPRILPVQPGVLCRTALSYSKLPTPASLSGQQKHPHGQHWKTPNPTPHQGTLPKTVKRTPARSARGSPSLSLNLYVLLPSPAQPGNLSNLPNL